MPPDSSPPSSSREPSAISEPLPSGVREQRRFLLALAGRGELGCRDVAGFREAALAASDPRAPAPVRLTLVDPDDAGAALLEAWAEDVEQVRRRLTVRRADGVEVSLVATLASFGEGVATSLAVESVGALPEGAILRSGVHSRAEVEAALARMRD